MDSPIDYANCEDAELIEIYGRLDALRAPAVTRHVKDLLISRGFVVPEGDAAIGQEILPSREKLQQLIGVGSPIVTPVFFGDVPGTLGWLQPVHNDFNMAGNGTLEADGIYLKMACAKSRMPLSRRKAVTQKGARLNWRRIVNVEIEGNAIRLGYQVPNEKDAHLNLWFPDHYMAARIAAVLPKARTAAFRPQLRSEIEYQEQLLRHPPKSTATLALLAVNVLVFLGAALGGAGWIIPNATIEVAAGSNLGSLTAHGEWWRVLSALFVHFGLIHLLLDMWALAAFGSLAERLLGARNFLFVYFVSGIAANLVSITVRPEINSGGASAAIFGILGALLAVYWRNKRELPFVIFRSKTVAVCLFTGATFLYGLRHAGIENAANVAGLLTGLLLGVAFSAKRTSDGKLRTAVPTFGVLPLTVAGLILGSAFMGAMHASKMPKTPPMHDPAKT